jgi:hypothetical protein
MALVIDPLAMGSFLECLFVPTSGIRRDQLANDRMHIDRDARPKGSIYEEHNNDNKRPEFIPSF